MLLTRHHELPVISKWRFFNKDGGVFVIVQMGAKSLVRMIMGVCLVAGFAGGESRAGDYQVSVRGNQILLNDRPIKIIGLRCSNALVIGCRRADVDGS